MSKNCSQENWKLKDRWFAEMHKSQAQLSMRGVSWGTCCVPFIFNDIGDKQRGVISNKVY